MRNSLTASIAPVLHLQAFPLLCMLFRNAHLYQVQEGIGLERLSWQNLCELQVLLHSSPPVEVTELFLWHLNLMGYALNKNVPLSLTLTEV